VPVKAGLNRFTWDLRYPGAADFPGIVLWGARLTGPRALPGTYRVRLTVDGRAPQAQEFRVLKDPRLATVTQADLEKQFQLAMRARDRTTDANRAVLLIRGIREQIDARLAQTQDPTVRAAARASSALATCRSHSR